MTQKASRRVSDTFLRNHAQNATQRGFWPQLDKKDAQSANALDGLSISSKEKSFVRPAKDTGP
jgi:hypothetical protein